MGGEREGVDSLGLVKNVMMDWVAGVGDGY